MKKKFVLILVILCAAAVANVHAFGLGAQFNLYPNSDFGGEKVFAPGFSLLFSPSKELNLAGNWNVNTKNSKFYVIGVTADFVPAALTFKLAGSAPLPMRLIGSSEDPKAWTLNLTLGIGAYANFWFNSNDLKSITGGVRAPIGFNFTFSNGLFEIFTHCAPSLVVNLSPEFGLGDWSFPVAVGARIWF